MYNSPMDPSDPTSQQPYAPQPGQPTPSQAGSKLLSKYSDTEHLLVRSAVAPTESSSSKPVIPLRRFQELEQAIRHAPANPEPYVELGQIYLEQQRWVDAKRVLDNGVQNCPEWEPLVLMREDLVLHLASQTLDAARTQQAQNPSEKSRYDLDQAEQNLANQRIRVCGDRYARRPDEKEILVTWAVALRQLGRHDEAIDMLKTAAAEPELRARASLQLGMCLQSLQRPLEALAAFRKASMYRSPPPDPKIQQRALELATDVAEENRLIDSARFYAEQLLAICSSSERESVKRRLFQLREKEL